MLPSLGRIVLYTVSHQDAGNINRRRTNNNLIAQAVHDGTWLKGVQAHIGNEVYAGTEVPAVIVAVWGDTPTPDTLVNLKCLLDGTDDYWVTSVKQNLDGDSAISGEWREPPRV